MAVILLCLFAATGPRRPFRNPTSTVVMDRNGELLGARIAKDGQWRFPQPDSLPGRYVKCLIEFEDKWYRWHLGVNPASVIRAMVQNVRAGHVVSGGSTITMQTVRLWRNKRRTWAEKCIESVLAFRLELTHSKKSILKMYAANAPFGGNVVGIEAACWRYFGHSPQYLTWAEAATLAVLPNAPSSLHISRNRESLMEKRNRLLKRLADKGEMDEISLMSALDEPLPGQPLPLPSTAPHLVEWFAKRKPGQRVTSTVDIALQRQIENIVRRMGDGYAERGIRNMAALVVDVTTNEVIAYCGNRDFNDLGSGGRVDIIRAPRSTGSILKPLLYCAMLQSGQTLPGTLWEDTPLNINGFTPQNFNQNFEGAAPAREVVARSLNVPSVNMLREYTVPRFHDFLKRTGMTTLTRPPSHYGLSLILGGAEGRLWDLAGAYSAMTRTLVNLPHCSLSLVEGEGERVGPNPFEAGSAWLTCEAIKEVNRPGEIDWRNIPSIQNVAWKTGTSYGFRDAWAIGATRRYVVGVWVGNASGEGRPMLTGASTAGPVMFELFNILPRSRWFARPGGGLERAVVCRKSGYLAGRLCEERDTIFIPPAGEASPVCPYHRSVTLTPDGKYQTYEDAPGGCVTASRFVLPPRIGWYYRRAHPDYQPLPPYRGAGSGTPMQFIYPTPGVVIAPTRQLDGTPGEVNFRLAHDDVGATVYWHLDEEYIGSTQDYHQLPILPAPGRHRMTVVDEMGNTVSVSFTVRGE